MQKIKNKHNLFKKNNLTYAIISLFPLTSYSLDLAQSPPGTTDPYVAPNVIISIDDSGSMQWRLDRDNSTDINPTTTPINGSWPAASRRMNVLKHALTTVFEDRELIPNEKIRIAWQAMWNGGKSPGVGAQAYYSGFNSKAGANNVNSKTSGTNSMKILDESHRTNFLDFVSKLTWDQNATHSHMLFSQADSYLRSDLGINSPWASIPGKKAEPFLGCRRNYHIFMTDGRWNGTASGGNKDGQPIELPDGTSYTPHSSNTKIYSDLYSNTLADWAFHSWSSALQPTLYDKTNLSKQVPTPNDYRKASQTENFGSTSLDKYWNPKYNPANWPHLVTYTIGFSNAAITWPGASSIAAPSQKVPFGYDNSFIKLIEGTQSWPAMDNENKRSLDLWHAAINGRGRFYAVEDGSDLEKAFREIIGTINAQAEPDRSSVAISGTSAERKPVGTYITYNEPKEAWRGGVKSFIIDKEGQKPAWGGKSTAEILDTTSADNRTIITWNDNKEEGSPFRWTDDENNISQSQKNHLNLNADSQYDNLGKNRLAYLRGDRSQEGTSSTNFRARKSKQGDIVNSSVWYTGAAISNYPYKGYKEFIISNANRKPMIYVGGNDGMLHGFSTEDGIEKIAYIPRGVYPNLSRLSWQTYDDNHRYYVDGSPMSGDVDIADKSTESYIPNWQTLLVGTLGAGGKGYFVLNVTNAGKIDTTTSFEEKNAKNLVIMDKTMYTSEPSLCSNNNCLTDPNADIGHIFSSPSTDENNPLRAQQITLLNNNRWAVILGNGYNSKNQLPVLLIQYLDGEKELLRIPATSNNQASCTKEQLDATNNHLNSCHNVTDNGLSAPRLVDINGDGRPDVVYAGDIKGNLWKFFIGSKSSDNWKVALDGNPLFTALGGTQGSPNVRTMRQSITAPPTVRSNDRSYTTGSGQNMKVNKVGGMMISFGTGRNVTTADPANEDVQTLYSVIDNTRYVVEKDPLDNNNYVSIHPGNTTLSIPAPEAIGMGVSKLAQQKIENSKNIGEQESLNREFWAMDSSNSTNVNWATHKGWYLDFPMTGERLLKPMSLYDGSNILAVYSQVPAKGSNTKEGVESCESSTVDAEVQYLTLINIMDGQRPSVQLMDLNGDGIYDTTADKYVSRQKIEKGAHTRIVDGKHIKDIGKSEEFKLARMPEQSMRPSWRQLK